MDIYGHMGMVDWLYHIKLILPNFVWVFDLILQ